MCCNEPLQKQAKLVGSISLTVSIIVVIFLQVTLFVCSSNWDGNVNYDNNRTVDSNQQMKNCNIRLDKKHEYNYAIVISVATIFLVVIDIPSSMLLLWGSKLKLKSYIVPWVIVNGFKAIIIIPAFAVIAWCIHIHVQDNIEFYSQRIGQNNQSMRFSSRYVRIFAIFLFFLLT